MIFLSLLSRKVNQFAGFLGPHTTGHHRGPTQGSYQKPAGKVNQIPTNPRHFPLWSTHYRALQVPHTGELSGNRRESEPYSHESWALSPMAHALPRLHSSTMHFPEQLKKLFEIFSKVLYDTILASFRHFYRKIALLFSSKNGKKPARKHVSNF